MGPPGRQAPVATPIRAWSSRDRGRDDDGPVPLATQPPPEVLKQRKPAGKAHTFVIFGESQRKGIFSEIDAAVKAPQWTYKSVPTAFGVRADPIGARKPSPHSRNVGCEPPSLKSRTLEFRIFES